MQNMSSLVQSEAQDAAARAIRGGRAIAKMSQRDLAAAADVAQNTVVAYEAGKAQLRSIKFRQIADVFGWPEDAADRLERGDVDSILEWQRNAEATADNPQRPLRLTAYRSGTVDAVPELDAANELAHRRDELLLQGADMLRRSEADLDFELARQHDLDLAGWNTIRGGAVLMAVVPGPAPAESALRDLIARIAEARATLDEATVLVLRDSDWPDDVLERIQRLGARPVTPGQHLGDLG